MFPALGESPPIVGTGAANSNPGLGVYCGAPKASSPMKLIFTMTLSVGPNKRPEGTDQNIPHPGFCSSDGKEVCIFRPIPAPTTWIRFP